MLSKEDSEFILEHAIKQAQLETKLKDKRNELLLLCSKNGGAEQQDLLRRECHDLLDLVIDNETTSVSLLVGKILKDM